MQLHSLYCFNLIWVWGFQICRDTSRNLPPSGRNLRFKMAAIQDYAKLSRLPCFIIIFVDVNCIHWFWLTEYMLSSKTTIYYLNYPYYEIQDGSHCPPAPKDRKLYSARLILKTVYFYAIMWCLLIWTNFIMRILNQLRP